MTNQEKNKKIQQIRDYAKEINSPLSIQDIGLLITYGQTGEPHSISDYLQIWYKWMELNNGQIIYLDNKN